MKKQFSPKDFKTNNFGNNHITIECLFSADFKNQTEEHFKECLKNVPVINNLFISKNKCDNDKHYEQIKTIADICLTMAMIERRLGIVKNDGSN